MKLTAKVREKEKKRDAIRIRREGDIPAVLYTPGKATRLLTVKGDEFAALVRTIKKDHLSTTKICLDVEGKSRDVIVKDIQYHPTSYQVIHLDFEELLEDVPVTIPVPVNCTGVMECAGIKLGGYLRQVMRQVKVQCLPKIIPASFDLDVSQLGILQSLRLSDLKIPEGIRPLANLSEVVVVIVKR
ncbi:MAG: 50S ribosomal protein L25/general stress protein Ctc [Chlamydiae bacterium GWC2_50_10]|nr:MAG: 50S ribosomal protein L25/general stress protein Ctc [Chlamydiae bacterium GWA2_50_15]OGN54102.1 MAG: 50S ribosomal protein L25/general stress protein Ctc [Chlamydiae bacterium GWC2_50_10]OGN54480.1 MAG: 50S ribosomal protein L25/general stress protein Ctc [Chlamydiae bacterium GWF2_49_8]OGN57565.1 MAG: 50S ribosomal protein L25/general stress protein Ctc [Chlamydiae bacterium RIFCSPHIGHO2_02_FULL_49_29]OGN63074.1 MAG: 50S ribosomal protein L25/general stress protein Ctc [Chlamydiae bac